jgi:hypothetical protein
VAWPVYSVRFIIASNVAGTYNYVVPAGKRAVVKSVSAFNTHPTTTQNVYLNVGPTLWAAAVPAQAAATPPEIMIVAYAGDTIGLVIQHGDLRAQCSGYLLEDPGGAAEDPPVPGQLPALGPDDPHNGPS